MYPTEKHACAYALLARDYYWLRIMASRKYIILHISQVLIVQQHTKHPYTWLQRIKSKKHFMSLQFLILHSIINLVVKISQIVNM